MRLEGLKNYFETELNNVARDKDYDISFAGEVGYYNHDWIKRQEGIQVTPYVLIPNRWQRRNDSTNTFDFSFTLLALPKETDRDKIKHIFDTFSNGLTNDVIDSYNADFLVTNLNYHEKFSESSGSGIDRFHAEIVFEGKITNALNFSDIELSFGDILIGVESFKYEHAKTNYLNRFEEFDDINNKNLNSNILVIETVLTKEGETLTNLLNKGQTVNIIKPTILKLNGIEVINDNYSFDNYSVIFDKANNEVRVYLFFSIEADKNEIILGNNTVTILDYAITTVVNSLPHNSPNDNIYKHTYLGRARAYAFNVVEDSKNIILNIFIEELMGERDLEPIFNLEIKIHGVTYNKRLLLSEITKESKETANNVLTLNFKDAGAL